MQRTIKDMWKNAQEKMRGAKASAPYPTGAIKLSYYNSKRRHDVPAIITVFLMISFCSFFGSLAAGLIIIWIM